jgi:hypothetical protein
MRIAVYRWASAKPRQTLSLNSRSPEIHRQAAGGYPELRTRTSRVEEVVLPASASPGHCRDGRSVCAARERPHGSETIQFCEDDRIIWSDYQRQETKQPEKVLEFLGRMAQDAGINPQNAHLLTRTYL